LPPLLRLAAPERNHTELPELDLGMLIPNMAGFLETLTQLLIRKVKLFWQVIQLAQKLHFLLVVILILQRAKLLIQA